MHFQNYTQVHNFELKYETYSIQILTLRVILWNLTLGKLLQMHPLVLVLENQALVLLLIPAM